MSTRNIFFISSLLFLIDTSLVDSRKEATEERDDCLRNCVAKTNDKFRLRTKGRKEGMENKRLLEMCARAREEHRGKHESLAWLVWCERFGDATGARCNAIAPISRCHGRTAHRATRTFERTIDVSEASYWLGQWDRNSVSGVYLSRISKVTRYHFELELDLHSPTRYRDLRKWHWDLIACSSKPNR